MSLMLVLNFLCFIMEFAVGFYYNSMVLTADAFNVLSDFLGVVIALVCMKVLVSLSVDPTIVPGPPSSYAWMSDCFFQIAAKGPSERNTFGWTRCDVLGALINAVFMIALCVTIFLDSLQRFIEVRRHLHLIGSLTDS